MTIKDLGDITSFKWATVTVLSPLAIKLDGDSAALALVPESLVDPLTLLVGDRVRVELTLRKCIIHGVASDGAQSGEMKLTAVGTAPRGWMFSQGQSLLRATYPRLFTAIGTTYGAVNSTHFSLPDTRGRVPVGQDTAQTEFDVLGEKGGEKTHLLIGTEIPTYQITLSHHGDESGSSVRQFSISGSGASSGQAAVPGSYIAPGGATGGASSLRAPWVQFGGGIAHNILQPYIALNYIIKL